MLIPSFSFIYLFIFSEFFINSNYFFLSQNSIFAVSNSCIICFKIVLFVLIPKTGKKRQVLIYLMWFKSLSQFNNGSATHNRNLFLFLISTRPSIINSLNAKRNVRECFCSKTVKGHLYFLLPKLKRIKLINPI